MAENIVYIVMGTSGEYSDRTETAIEAWLDEGAAQKRVIELTEASRAHAAFLAHIERKKKLAIPDCDKWYSWRTQEWKDQQERIALWTLTLPAEEQLALRDRYESGFEDDYYLQSVSLKDLKQ